MGIYATYVSNGVKKRPMLAICPFLNETTHMALSHYDTIVATLNYYEKTIADLLYMIGDNCSTMRKLAREHLQIPLIGCYSHKLNLAVKNWLGMAYTSEVSVAFTGRSQCQLEREKSVMIVHKICTKMRTMINTAKLRELLNLDYKSILIDQNTRWLSISNMVARFVELYPAIQELANNDLELSTLMPTHVQMNKIRSLSTELKNIHAFTVGMQSSKLDMLTARMAFSALETKYGEDFSKYLSDDAGC